MPQIITFSKVLVMYFYAMKMITFGTTCIGDHLFKDHFRALFAFLLQPSFQQAKFSFIED